VSTLVAHRISSWSSVAGLFREPRLALAAISTFTIILGVVAVSVLAPSTWGVDIARNLQATRDLAAGRFGTDAAYLYSPLAALLTVPLAILPIGVAIAVWLGVKLAVLAWGIRRETRGLRPVDAILAGIAIVVFVPTAYDLLLGNVTVLVVASVALVAWRRDGWASGLALGLVLATAPKPQLIPVLMWMLLNRPRALTMTLAVAGGLSALGLAVLGVGPYLEWVGVLRAPEYFESSMAGNLTPDAVLPWVAIPIKVWAVAGFLYALRRGEMNGFVAALAIGLLIAPYTMDYAAMMLLLGIRPMLATSPRGGVFLTALGPLAAFVALPLYAMAWLAAGAITRFPTPASGSGS
jgi:hypothetical protein